MADRRAGGAGAAALLVCWSLVMSAQTDTDVLARRVADAERAFARSMAERNHAAFSALLSDHAVFFGNGSTVLRGKAAVAADRKRFFETAAAPLS